MKKSWFNITEIFTRSAVSMLSRLKMLYTLVLSQHSCFANQETLSPCSSNLFFIMLPMWIIAVISDIEFLRQIYIICTKIGIWTFSANLFTLLYFYNALMLREINDFFDKFDMLSHAAKLVLPCNLHFSTITISVFWKTAI